MKVPEQLEAWALHPDSELLVSFAYDEKPCVVGRIKARDAVAGFNKRFADATLARFQAIKGIPCVIIEGTMPNAPHSHYRAVLSAAKSFK